MSSILDVLGGHKERDPGPGSTREWVDRISAGLPIGSALGFKRALGLTNEELGALLGVSTRSLARWDPARGRLDPVASDRLYRVARLFDTAVEVLESRDEAVRWLRLPQRALGNAVPLDLATTDVGTRAVEALLGRMEHGVYT
jgi:putative toxin-antitoxin system antitoxin component (TIGR02293 family)